MRTKYDEWRGGGFKSFLSFDEWLALQSRVHTVSPKMGLLVKLENEAQGCNSARWTSVCEQLLIVGVVAYKSG